MAPLAGLAEMSAIGMGVAGQAFGLWLHSMSNALSLTQRMMSPMLDEDVPDADAFRDASRGPDLRAGAAVEELRAGIGSIMDDVAAGSPTGETAAAPAETPVTAVRPASIDRPQTPDDLKAISGVGPKLEQVLNGYGIWTLAQIAALGPQEIAWLEEAVGFKGRIERDGWVGQAAALATAGGHG